MDKKDFADWGIKAGALALAMLLWFHAVTEHPYEKKVDIRLKVEDPPSEPFSEEIIVANLLRDHVKVLVSGNGKDLLRFNSDGFLLRVQPEGEAGSVLSYRLTPADVENRIAELDVQIAEILDPKEIEIVLGRRAERIVQVIPFVELEIAKGYTQIGGVRIEPKEVEISGPSTQILKVEAIATDSLLKRNVREYIKEKLLLHKPPGMRLKLSPEYVMVEVDIQILVEDDFAHIPVRVRHKGGHSVLPVPARVQVTVKGGFGIITNLDPEKDLALYVDYRDYDGKSLPVVAEEDSLFEIIKIIPPEVNLVEH